MSSRRHISLAANAGRAATGVLVAVAAVLVLALGSGAAACKFAFECGIGGGHVQTDAELLRQMQEEAAASRAVLPRGVHEEVVASGLRYPTDFSFLPGGDVLVSEKEGLILRVSPGRPGRRVVLDLRKRLNTYDYRGIMTVAASPSFAEDHTIYVLYVPKRPHADPTGPTIARFSAFVLSSNGAAAREHVLLGSVTAPSCSKLPSTADCLPSDLDHDGAQVAFAKDGTLFLSTGDGGGYDSRIEPSALDAQDPDSLSGKVLHFDREGNGLRGNPWWNGDPRANRSKVWAIGLRNPFRLVLDPRTSVPIVGDVGRHAFEELDAAKRGANLGWPCWEAAIRAEVYAKTPVCRRIYRRPRAELTWPLLALPHPTSTSIVAGAFAPSDLPAPYGGALFFADWAQGWIRFAHVSANDEQLVGPAHGFATKAPGPVAVHLGADGHMYYLALSAGDLRRIDVEP